MSRPPHLILSCCCCRCCPRRRSCQRLAHELRYYNLEAPQLDVRLRPPEPPEHRLVLVGGEGPLDGPDPSQVLQCYDHKAGGWGRLADMGVRRLAGCGAAAVGTRLYAFGGESDGLGVPGCMTMYDMASRKVEQVGRPPRALQYCGGVSCDGLVYSLGGLDSTLHRVADVQVYNPDIDCWVVGPPLPLAVQGISAVEHAGCVFACGGWPLGNRAPSAAALHMLDPRTRAWASLPAMPTPTVNAGAAVLGGRLYVPGGSTGVFWRVTTVTTLQCYDMAAGRWDTGCAAMLEASRSHVVAAVRGELWTVGGRSASTNQALAAVEVYSPWLNAWRMGVPLPHAWCGGACAVVQC